MSPRQLPCSLEAERAVLGGAVIKPTAFAAAVSLGMVAEDFILPAHREIWEAMRALALRRIPVDLVPLINELRTRGMLSHLEGGETYLLTLAESIPTAENIEHYVRIVREKSTLRRLIGVCSEVATMAYGANAADEVVHEAQRLVHGLATRDSGGAPVPLSQSVPEAIDLLEARAADQRANGVMSGLVALDRLTGGFQRENLVVIAARPKVGKTALAGSILINAARDGVPCLLFSLEMSQVEMVWRKLAQVSRVSAERIHSATVDLADWRRINSAWPALAELPIWIMTKARTVSQIASIGRAWWAQRVDEARARGIAKPIGLIALDYIQLLRGGARQSRQEVLAEGSQALKDLAVDTGCPVLELSQLNREIEKREDGADWRRKHKLSDLRGAGELEQDPDLIMFVERDTESQDEEGPALIDVRAHRHGKTGDVEVWWNGTLMRFQNGRDREHEQGELAYGD